MIPSIELRRVIRAPKTRVFEAWTSPEHLKNWWGPGQVSCPEAEVDLRVGGSYRIANLHPDGEIVWIEGEFEKVVPPDELVYSWSAGKMTGDPTRVTVWFNDHADGTELVLRHERFQNAEIRENHLHGWGGCLDGLDAYLAG